MTAADFHDEKRSIFMFGTPPFRIDILQQIDGVDFDGAWHRRAIVDLDGYPAPVLSKDDLIASKLAAGRPQDLIDVERLRKVRNS